MGDIFISYSHKDRDRVEPLVALLRRRGWEVRWDQDFRGGINFYDKLNQFLSTVRCMVVVWTQSSIRSQWVGREAAEGARRNMLVPVRLEDVEVPIGFGDVLSIDLIDWDGSEVASNNKQLIDSVERMLARPRSRGPRGWAAAIVVLLAVAGALAQRACRDPSEAYLVQLVPDWPLSRLLPLERDAEAQRYELILEFDGGTSKIEDLHFGVVYAGPGDREDLRRRIEELPQDELHSTLDRYLAGFILEEAPRQNRVAELLANAEYLPTPELVRDDELRAKVVCAGAQTPLADHPFTIIGSSRVQMEPIEGNFDPESPCGPPSE